MSVGYQNGDRQKLHAAAGAHEGAAPASEDWNAVKDEMNEAASDMASAARERGRQFIDSAKDQAATYVDRRKDSAAQSVEDIASSLRESGGAFDDRPNIKAFVDSAADGLEHLADQVRSRSFADMYADVEDFARRHPATFASAATVAGFLMARFLKSSAEDAEYRRHQARQSARARTARAGRGATAHTASTATRATSATTGASTATGA